MKKGQPHVVPLTDKMIELLRALPVVGDGKYIFSVSGKAPINGASKWLAQLRQRSGTENWTPHDLRRTARTLWSPIPNVSDTVKELCLAHAHGDAVRQTYDRHTYGPEMRQLFEVWERMLLAIVEPEGQPANVVPLVVKPTA
jgi:integrase